MPPDRPPATRTAFRFYSSATASRTRCFMARLIAPDEAVTWMCRAPPQLLYNLVAPHERHPRFSEQKN